MGNMCKTSTQTSILCVMKRILYFITATWHYLVVQNREACGVVLVDAKLLTSAIQFLSSITKLLFYLFIIHFIYLLIVSFYTVSPFVSSYFITFYYTHDTAFVNYLRVICFGAPFLFGCWCDFIVCIWYITLSQHHQHQQYHQQYSKDEWCYIT